MNLHELGVALGLKTKGDPLYVINGVRDIETLSLGEGLQDHYVYFIETPAVLKRHPRAGERGCILTTPFLADRFSTALIAPEDGARLALISLLKKFDRAPSFSSGVSADPRVHPTAEIAPSASILPGAVVMAGASVGKRSVLYPGVVVEPYAKVGDDTVLFPGVVVGHHCEVGDRCILHGNTVIGADGFGFFDNAAGRHKLPQIGNVVIADNVEIGASCTVDRATIESTTIGAHTKIDDQVHVGHNCRVGRLVYIVGNSALGGSVIVEDGAMISGMVIVKDHLKIAKGSIVMGMTAVAQDTEPKTAYFGVPARPARQMHKMNAALERLPELLGKIRDLEAQVALLQSTAVKNDGIHPVPASS